jgi:hypothetical protein
MWLRVMACMWSAGDGVHDDVYGVVMGCLCMMFVMVCVMVGGVIVMT